MTAELRRKGVSHSDTDYDDEDPLDKLWTNCASLLWKHEKSLIDETNKELDALLSFSAIFSAAVTAFAVAYYVSLGSATNSNAAAVLAQISSHLESFHINLGPHSSGFINSTHSTHSPSSSIVAEHTLDLSIDVNALWFVALVLSLSAASVTIYVKQWLNRYTAPNVIVGVPRQSVLMWYSRHQSASAWGVTSIISIIPLLLQSALIIFVVALVLWLKTLNDSVFSVTATVVGLLLLCSVAITIMPSLNAHCPYRSPQALVILNAVILIKYMYLRVQENIEVMHGRLRRHRNPADLERKGSHPHDHGDTINLVAFDPSKNTTSPSNNIQIPSHSLVGGKDPHRNIRFYVDWLKYERDALNGSLDAATITDQVLLATAYNTLMLDNATAFVRTVLRPYAQVKEPQETALVLKGIYDARMEAISSVDGSIANDNLRDAKFERVTADAIGALTKQRRGCTIRVPEPLIDIVEKLISRASAYMVFQSLLDFVKCVCRPDLADCDEVDCNEVDRILTLILDNIGRFQEQMDYSHYDTLISCIPYTIKKHLFKTFIRISLEMLMSSTTRQPLEPHMHIRERLHAELLQIVPGLRVLSVDPFSIFSTCAKIMKEKAEEYILELKQEEPKATNSRQRQEIIQREKDIMEQSEKIQRFETTGMSIILDMFNVLKEYEPLAATAIQQRDKKFKEAADSMEDIFLRKEQLYRLVFAFGSIAQATGDRSLTVQVAEPR